MKTVIRISTDYQSTESYDDFVEQVTQLVNELVEVHCEVKNKDFTNIVEKVQKTYVDRDTLTKCISFSATGYCQSEWQGYVLRYNCEDDNIYLKQLIDELKKSFTHMNDYCVHKFEREVINGKNFDAEPHDYTAFSIRDIEFPEKEQVLARYNEIYGEDYDIVIVEVD